MYSYPLSIIAHVQCRKKNYRSDRVRDETQEEIEQKIPQMSLHKSD